MKMTEPKRLAELQCDKIKLAVFVEPNGKIWRHMDLSFGSYGEADFATSTQSWPLEAITEARRQLDELEAKLEEDE